MSKNNKVGTPLLSVIVPVYNVENYLSRCIESILNQTYSNLELILVDDGSKDASFEICNEYKDKDLRVVVEQQANAGSSVARNTGLKIAKGEYIGFVDSDDWIQPTMYEDMITFAISKNLSVVECGHITSKAIETDIELINQIVRIESQEVALERIIKADSFAVWRRVYHTDIIKGMTFIPGKIHQDVFFTLDVVDQIKNMGVVSGKHYIYNIENESVIRSAYSLKKLDAKDAVYYVQNIASKYNTHINRLGNRYLIKGLINHYIPLFENENLDPDYKHRKQLKSEIKQHYCLLDRAWSIEKIRALLVLNTPFWLYKTLLRFNKQRIKLKIKLMSLRNV